jgi:putative CocE/NonD family hydrolase
MNLEPEMRKILIGSLLFLGCLTILSNLVAGQSPSAVSIRETYTKFEFRIPMRDGARLFTTIYAPKDKTRSYPFLLTRTPYGVGPYGADNYRTSLPPGSAFEKEGFIFVYQDARGRHLSEGTFEQVRPHLPEKKSRTEIDESTDTYDTIEWLLQNIPHHNGRVGTVGISQPGFHVAAGMIDAHPALKAVSPQAPTADYYLGDDVYHNGAFMLAANFGFYGFFQPRLGPPTPPGGPTARPILPDMSDGYRFFLGIGRLVDVNETYFGGKASYWQEIVEHPNYDDFWQKRSLWKFMEKIHPAVLNVGGWFDAEDPIGPFHIYRAVEKKSPSTPNRIVMGPWCHGCWANGDGDRLGNLDFGVKTAVVFREQILLPFFLHYLKDQPADLAKAWMFLTGINEWRRHETWPPRSVEPLDLYFAPHGTITTSPPAETGPFVFDQYISDPNRPVPYLGYIAEGMTRDYMTEDQRFASQRPDVLVYSSPELEDDLTIAGPIRVSLTVSTTGTDSDFIVKLIDVYPSGPTAPRRPAISGTDSSSPPPPLSGYQQLVRGEPFRAKFREGFERPIAMTPEAATRIDYEMPDVYHTFRSGHRVMIQIQSSWFPLIDRNPQTFVDIPRAQPADYRTATQRIFRSKDRPSLITVQVEPSWQPPGSPTPRSAPRF